MSGGMQDKTCQVNLIRIGMTNPPDEVLILRTSSNLEKTKTTRVKFRTLCPEKVKHRDLDSGLDLLCSKPAIVMIPHFCGKQLALDV